MGIEKLGKDGLDKVWKKVFSLIKILTGDVTVNRDGTLQDQIDELKYSLAEGKVNFHTTSEDGSYITTEDGYCIISEFKI